MEDKAEREKMEEERKGKEIKRKSNCFVPSLYEDWLGFSLKKERYPQAFLYLLCLILGNSNVHQHASNIRVVIPSPLIRMK